MKNNRSLIDMLLDYLAGIGREPSKRKENEKEHGTTDLGRHPAGETGEQGEGSLEDQNMAAGDAGDIIIEDKPADDDGDEDKSGGRPLRKKGKRRGSKKGSPPRPKRQLSEKQKIGIELRRLIQKILIVAAVVVTLLTFVGGVHIWHDNNMFPNVKDGDLVITFKLGGCYNGDIVLYKIDGETRMGRVVGIPGDTIDIGDDGTYTINGTVPYETIYFATKPAAGSSVSYPYTVKEGEVFIFNDMRDMTYDSRVYGGISETKGKVVLVIRRRGF